MHFLWCSWRYTGEGEGGISNITVVEAKMVSIGWAADQASLKELLKYNRAPARGSEQEWFSSVVL